ncbi:MAG TPA: DUF3105 domain-containing protein [Dehalococcoidia bacterium]|nr:DUF3105 domain-containing protein [Dehalococcoidia bacterium]
MSSKRSNARLERRAEREARVSPPRRDRNQTYKPKGRGLLGAISVTSVAIAGGVAIIVALLVYVVTQQNNVDTTSADWQKAQLDDSPSLPGVYVAPHPGIDGKLGTSDDRQHFVPGTIIPICTAAQIEAGDISGDSLCYTSNPPTSGPHSSTPMSFKVLDNPGPKENLIHNMEHGGIVVWYNTTDQAVIDQLKKVVQGEIDRRRLVVMTAYSGMEPNTIALTAWTRLDKFSAGELTDKRVETFIDAHNKRFNPEGF